MRFSFATLVALTLMASTANAEFVVWLSDRGPGESPVAGPLDLMLPSAGAMGNLYLYGDGSTQLSGLSLDLAATGDAIRFTSMNVNNPAGRWSFLDGPVNLTDSLVTNIGGAAIPPGAPGVGGPVADEVAGTGFLLATIGYMGLGNAVANSALELRVGSNLIADYEGNAAMVRLGGPGAPLMDGTIQGAMGAAGIIAFGDVVQLPGIEVSGNGMGVLDDDITPSEDDNTDFGTVAQGSVQTRNFTITNTGDADLTLGDPIFTGPFSLVGGSLGTISASDSAILTIGLNTALLGPQSGSISFGTNVAGLETFNFDLAANVIPEPASLTLFGLALIGMIGLGRRRS